MQARQFTKESLTIVAQKYKSRAEWSVNDPDTYDFAIMQLSEPDFLDVTKHMYDQQGLIMKGDPGDPEISTMKRRLSRLRIEHRRTGKPELLEEIALVQFRINSRCVA